MVVSAKPVESSRNVPPSSVVSAEKSGIIDAYLLCLPESSGSSLYGMLEILAVTGTAWRTASRAEPGRALIRPHVVSPTGEPYTGLHGIPIRPDLAFRDVTAPEVVIITDLWLTPDDAITDRHEEAKAWLRSCFEAGSTIYSACSGSVLLAAAGLLDGRIATSHWGLEDLFRRSFPLVRFEVGSTLCLSDPTGRLVTSGGASSWHDLAIHIISRHTSPGEALDIAKFFLMKWHSEGQLPYSALVRRLPHADGVVRRAEAWLAENYAQPDPVAAVVKVCGIAERSLKRRFKDATGTSLLCYAQNLRIEAAKRILETDDRPVESIATAVGYGNQTFFREVFKRSTGLTPAAYRRMFRPFVNAA
ncbi:AraC family transcriptional regulator [Acuticoccus sediminis]|uniref:AraC family transcriptional regulator n=1 Tax=Acuticoccus sediminis TaxID=2184697 RepID=A0A8B2NME1_9HYPH|nr:AraC family transcriptional regulator [Acuticoccus sediminis]